MTAAGETPQGHGEEEEWRRKDRDTARKRDGRGGRRRAGREKGEQDEGE